MKKTVVDQVCDMMDTISGQLIFEEGDDDKLEIALRLMKGATFSADETQAIKEHFDNALRRTKLLSDGSWFHTQLQTKYAALF